MKLNQQELDVLKANSLSLTDVKQMAELIDSDHSIGGIFPNGTNGDFSNADIEKFMNKWCSWWPIARILLTVAKAFTNDKVDKVIDALLKLGDSVCK
ncbi:MAG: hypothetical protein E6Q37_00460 [Crocinitomicaceae bacterium]|nr:MAG: hypothetical protein E6Q37_00460 [Crocinitomicaceae bacterium]